MKATRRCRPTVAVECCPDHPVLSKCKIVPVYAMKENKGNGGIVPLIMDLSAIRK